MTDPPESAPRIRRDSASTTSHDDYLKLHESIGAYLTQALNGIDKWLLALSSAAAALAFGLIPKIPSPSIAIRPLLSAAITLFTASILIAMITKITSYIVATHLSNLLEKCYQKRPFQIQRLFRPFARATNTNRIIHNLNIACFACFALGLFTFTTSGICWIYQLPSAENTNESQPPEQQQSTITSTPHSPATANTGKPTATPSDYPNSPAPPYPVTPATAAEKASPTSYLVAPLLTALVALFVGNWLTVQNQKHSYRRETRLREVQSVRDAYSNWIGALYTEVDATRNAILFHESIAEHVYPSNDLKDQYKAFTEQLKTLMDAAKLEQITFTQVQLIDGDVALINAAHTLRLPIKLAYREPAIPPNKEGEKFAKIEAQFTDSLPAFIKQMRTSLAARLLDN